ncbi:MAG: type II toxin-antitoxin system HicB family antitoxin [Anaerovoracaceae bacterium]
MNKLFYPALFHKAEEGGFWVSFPDLPECLTEGDNMDQAYEMAVDALGLVLTTRKAAGDDIPRPTPVDAIQNESSAYAVIINFDMDEYQRRTNSKAVKKTLSVPSWLNEEAIAKGINFSSVLQDALKERLGL